MVLRGLEDLLDSEIGFFVIIVPATAIPVIVGASSGGVSEAFWVCRGRYQGRDHCGGAGGHGSGGEHRQGERAGLRIWMEFNGFI